MIFENLSLHKIGLAIIFCEIGKFSLKVGKA